jgi:TonB-linked SusC/RagA family outer membrane protein
VTDEGGSPIAGVIVAVQGTNNAVLTGETGRYSITAPANGILDFSSIGMQSVSISIENRNSINVVMESDATAIDNVVVTGYGTIRRSAFTGSASVIGESIVAGSGDVNFLKSLDGAVSGLKTSSKSGIPGGYAEVYIRGVGSISSGREPLYVIDGMPIWAAKDAMSESDGIFFSPLANINSTDIESVTVLKDATATAIYGARAANGVIVVTTKKGKTGAMNVNFDMRFGINNIAPYTDKYKMIGAEKYFDIWAKSIIGLDEGLDTYEDALAYAKGGWDGTDTDWMKEITRTGAVQDLNLSVSGSTGNLSYYSSLGYQKNEGFIIGSGTERYSGRLNLEGRSDIFTYGMNTSYSQSLFDGIPNSSAYVNPVVAAYDATPNLPVYNEDGSYFMSGSLAAGYNPIAVKDEKYGDIQRQTISTLNANPYLSADFGYGISAKTSLGVSIYDMNEYNYWSSRYNPQGIDSEGLGQQYNTNRTNLTWTNTLNWNYTVGDLHNISLMLGQEAQRMKLFKEFYSASLFPIDGLRDMGTAGKEAGVPSNENTYARMASYFFNGEYDYANKYYLSASFRRDGFSGFGSAIRWGDFWSVGGKWRASEEAFLKDSDVISNLAIRASYGTVGNSDIGWYSARGFYEAGYNYNKQAGIVPTGFPNPDLSWEQSNKLNVGLDVGFMGRIDLTLDAYREVTSDMIFQMPLSLTTGVASIYKNIGSMKNTGVEIGITAIPVRTNDIVWSVYFNGTLNRNEVIKLSTERPLEGNTTIVEPGKPYFQFFMKEWAGVDPENGDPLWYDKDGNTTNNWNNAVKRYVGSADPKFYGGFGTSFTWKGIDLGMNFAYQLGGKVYNGGQNYDLQAGHYRFGPVSNYVYDNAWTEENRNTDVPKFVYGSRRGEYNASSRFLYSSNFLRLKTITLGYTLPKAWTEKAFMQSLRIYLTADNLFTVKHKDFIGFDPETSPDGQQAWAYPIGRSFSAGISIGF